MYIPILPSDDFGFRRRGDLIYNRDNCLIGHCTGESKSLVITIEYYSISPDIIESQLKLRRFAEKNSIRYYEEPHRKFVAELLRKESSRFEDLAKQMEGKKV